MRKPRLSTPIFFQQGQWAVTGYGIECTTERYAIGRHTVWEEHWPEHMHDKGWVNMRDFLAALSFARENYDRLWVKRPRTFVPIDLRDVREAA